MLFLFRANCLSNLRFNPITKCQGDCQKCWNFCQKFSNLPKNETAPANCAENRGCAVAQEAFNGTNNRENNRPPKGPKFARNFGQIKFEEKPRLIRESCILEWAKPDVDRNSVVLKQQQRQQEQNKEIWSNIVYVLFGKDLGDRWYEIGQTASTQIKLLPGKRLNF
jgi:hypothetical protein